MRVPGHTRQALFLVAVLFTVSAAAFVPARGAKPSLGIPATNAQQLPPALRAWFWPALPPAFGQAPQPNLERVVVGEIASAQIRILVLAYYLTNTAVADALAAARQRGVYVLVVLDQAQRFDNDSQGAFLQRRGVVVLAATRTGIDHNKVLVIDDEVITGSANLSGEGLTRNAENLVAIRDTALATLYSRYVQSRAEDTSTESYRYQGTTPVKRQ